MRLLRKQPESLEAALALASQWESVELAQQSLRGEKQGPVRCESGERDLVQGALRANTVDKLALQVQQLSQEIIVSCQVGKSVRKGALRKGYLSVGTASKKGIYTAQLSSAEGTECISRGRLGRTGQGSIHRLWHAR